MHTSPALYLSNAKKRYFLALNLLRIDSSLDIRAECHRKKCAIFIFYLLLPEKIQAKLEYHTSCKDF